jgi:molybdopterin biosynthesis enzyme
MSLTWVSPRIREFIDARECSSCLIPAVRMELQENAMRKGMAAADIIITTGGTSMGEADLLKVCLLSYRKVQR